MRKMNKHLRIGLIALIIFIVFIAASRVLSSMIQNGQINNILIPQKLEGLLVFVMFLPLLTALFFFGKFFESKKRFPIAKILKFMAIGLLIFAVLQTTLSFIGFYIPVRSGCYYAVGDYEEGLTPCLRLDTNTTMFEFCAGDFVSFAEQGSYAIEDDILAATSQSDKTYRFEIQDRDTLIFKGPEDNYMKIPIDTKFVFSKEFK